VYFNPRNFQTVAALHHTAANMGVPPMRLAITWVLAHPAVTTVLCGARDTAHLDNALAATHFELPVDWPSEFQPEL
jgi:L-glyceraldehyde 3-phosphate reductase